MLSKANANVVEAFSRGYRVIDNVLIGPDGKIRKVSLRKRKGYEFKRFTIAIKRDKNDWYLPSIPIHKLVAYQKFGEKVFESGTQIRHLDGNSLNNASENIDIGTASNNALDKPKEIRLKSSVNAATKVRKFTDVEMEDIRNMRRSGAIYEDIMNEFNITSKGSLHYMLNTKYKTIVK